MRGRTLASTAACLLWLLLAPAAATGQDAPRREVLAYYVPYDATSWASLEANPHAVDIVAAQWVTIDACGQIGSRDNQTLKRFAGTHGIQVLPSLLTLSGWLNHRILTDEAISATAIGQIVDYIIAEDYAGFDLDLEGVDPPDREAYTGFVAGLANALHANGRLLALALPAKERDVTVGWAGAFDYAALGRHADILTIMAYEYRGTWSGPGSVAPHDWSERVLAFVTSQVPAEKVRLGLAFYGYDWNVTFGSARALGYPQAAELATRYGADAVLDPLSQSAMFSYQAPFGDPLPSGLRRPIASHQITTREPPACDISPPSSPPPPRPARPTPAPDALQQHEVWFEESGGVLERVRLADRYGVGGVATWRLGQEDPGVWSVFDMWRTAEGR
jgi:spore germination protein